MNNYEPKAEKRKHVQRNQKKDELSQPEASSLDDSQPGFGDQSKLGFLWLEERWIHGVSFWEKGKDRKYFGTMVSMAAGVL